MFYFILFYFIGSIYGRINQPVKKDLHRRKNPPVKVLQFKAAAGTVLRYRDDADTAAEN